jgi:putative transposase
MTASYAGKVDVLHLCKLAVVSRASYYRRFEARAPREADVELTSHIQLLSLRHKFYGYRRITAVLRRSGLVVNAKRVQRLMREDLIAMRRKSVLTEPEPKLQIRFLTRFLHANRCPLRSKTL